MAAITNHHKLSGFTQHKCILLQFWKYEVQTQFHWPKSRRSFPGQNQGVSRVVPSEGPRGPFPHLSQLLVVNCIPWLRPLPPSSKSIIPFSASVITLPSPLAPTLQPPSYKDPCDDIGPTWMIQDDPPSSRPLIQSHLQSLFCHIRYIHRF